jgi:hypothetical protein
MKRRIGDPLRGLDLGRDDRSKRFAQGGPDLATSPVAPD